MNFQLSELQQMLVASAQRFVATNTGLEQWRDRRILPDGVSPKLWAQISELGWLGLAIPEEDGGFGGSMVDVALLMIEMGRGVMIEPVVSTGVLAAHVLSATLSGDERKTWLGRIMNGEARLVIAHAERDGLASNHGSISMIAQQEGDGFILNGDKFMVFDAPSAGYLIVSTTIEASREPALFLIDAKAAGIEAMAYPLIDGSRAADISFNAVRVPATAMLASGDAALLLLEAALDRARIALIAQAVGAMEATIQVTADYAKERKQFGQPIGKFQAIQHLAADMFVAAYQARSILYAALREIDGDATARSRAVSCAKVISGMSGQTVSRNGIQIHGGYGVTDEYAVSHYYRRLLVLEKQYGDIDSHLDLLALREAKVQRVADGDHCNLEEG